MILKHLINNSPDWVDFHHRYYHDHEAALIMSKSLSSSDIPAQLQFWQNTKFNFDSKAYTEAYLQHLTSNQHVKAKHEVRRILTNALSEFFKEAYGISDQDNRFAASIDGYAKRENVIFKYYSWHEETALFLRTHNDLPDHLWPGVEHQLYVSQAQYCICVISDGTTEKWMSIRYNSNTVRKNRLLRQWNDIQTSSRGSIQEKRPTYQLSDQAKTVVNTIHA